MARICEYIDAFVKSVICSTNLLPLISQANWEWVLLIFFLSAKAIVLDSDLRSFAFLCKGGVRQWIHLEVSYGSIGNFDCERASTELESDPIPSLCMFHTFTHILLCLQLSLFCSDDNSFVFDLYIHHNTSTDFADMIVLDLMTHSMNSINNSMADKKSVYVKHSIWPVLLSNQWYSF